MGCLIDRQKYLERQAVECAPDTECRVVYMWPDADGDGWGDRFELSERFFGRPDGRPDLANNYRDCDDRDSAVTANVGGLCPKNFGVDFVAHVDDDANREFVQTLGPAPPYLADDTCKAWGTADDGKLGASPTEVQALPQPFVGWIARDLGALDPSWDGAPGRSELTGGPVYWDGSLLHTGSVTDERTWVCSRTQPDEADYPTYEEQTFYETGDQGF